MKMGLWGEAMKLPHRAISCEISISLLVDRTTSPNSYSVSTTSLSLLDSDCWMRKAMRMPIVSMLSFSKESSRLLQIISSNLRWISACAPPSMLRKHFYSKLLNTLLFSAFCSSEAINPSANYDCVLTV
jgi:hypothetical protein